MTVRLFFDVFSGYFITALSLDGKPFLAERPVLCPCQFHLNTRTQSPQEVFAVWPVVTSVGGFYK